MSELQSILPEGWKRPPGFSQAIASPPVNLTIAGQFGWDPSTQECVPGGFGAQWEQSLRNIRTLVETAGGDVSDIVSLRVLVLDMAEYRAALPEVGAAWGSVFGKHFPAITMFEVGALTDADARLEIEATAALKKVDAS